MTRNSTSRMRPLDWLVTGATCLVLLAVGLLHGTAALLAAVVGSVAVGVARRLLDGLSAFAIGQVTFVAVSGSTPPPLPLIVGEGVLFGLLLTAVPQTPHHRRDMLTTLLFALGLGGIGWLALGTWNRLWAASGAVIGIGGLIAYLLHRYEQVQLGVIAGE